MRSQFIIFLIILSLPTFLNAQINGFDPRSVDKAEETIETYKANDSKFEAYFNDSYGYAVFPKIGKGAWVLGAAHGKGTVYEQNKVIGTAKITQLTLGLQIGGQTYSEIIFFETSADFRKFKNGKIKIAAQASAVAVKKGASGNLAYNDGVAVFSRSEKGLMYEASVGGQKLSFKPLRKK